MTAPSVGVWVHGRLAAFPLAAEVWTEAGSLCWEGRLRIEGHALRDLVLRLGDGDPLDPLLAALLDELAGRIPATLDVAQVHGLLTCSLSADGLSFWVLRRGKSLAFAIELGASGWKGAPRSAGVARFFEKIAEVRRLALPDLLLAYRRGDLSIGDLPGGFATSAAPKLVAGASWLLLGKYTFGESRAGQAIRQLFGGSGEIDLAAGYDAGAEKFTICLAVPAMQTKYVKVEGLYILVTVGGEAPRFEFRGGFRFPRWKDVALQASCAFTPTSFLLSAGVDFPQSFEIPFLEAVSFDNAAILIGSSSGGFTFGFFATLYIRKLLLFGALVLDVEGDVPVPLLVSGAVGRLSIASLYRDFAGHTLDGLDALDRFAVDGLDFSHASHIDVALLANKDTAGIARWFKAALDGPAFTLEPGEIQVWQHEGGYALVDRLRMRHYFVDTSGAVSLRAQFYYSVSKDIARFGDFSVSPGLFLCGRIEVFEARFEVLFSLRENEGLLAYARLGPIRIGKILTISASDHPSTRTPIVAHEGDPLHALLPPKSDDSLVFYLSASKREVAFYLDGKVELLDLFAVEASLLYSGKNVSVYLATDVFGVRAMVAIEASYENFMAARLHVRLSVDTKGLVEKLAGVTGAIEGAIAALTTIMNDAQRSLDAAQARVDGLQGEIDALDDRIEACNDAIARESGFKKLLVSIAKGAEIGAYEVAKAGVWTAMKAATAALSLAKKAVSVFAHLGPGILELVNTTIQAASSLFFLRHIEITADLDVDHQAFKVDVAFVALGKSYRYPAEPETVQLDVLRKGLLPLLETKLQGPMADDLRALARGHAPTPPEPRAFAARAVAEQAPSIPDIEGAAATLRTASSVFDLMQTQYRENFGEDLSDFDALRASFVGALEVADQALDTATKAAPGIGANSLHDAIQRRRGELSGEDLKAIDTALAEVEHASALQASVAQASNAMAVARAIVLPPSEVLRGAKARAFAAPQPRLPEADFLEMLYTNVVQIYAEEAEAGYIDLSREPTLRQSLIHGLSSLGSAPDHINKATTPVASFAAPRAGGRPYRPRL